MNNTTGHLVMKKKFDVIFIVRRDISIYLKRYLITFVLYWS